MTVEDIQAQWNAQYEAVVARMNAGVGAGLATPADIAGLTGLQQMQAMLDGKMPYPHIADTMDFSLVDIGEGRAVFQGQPPCTDPNGL